MQIAAIIIARNEATNIERCVTSLHGIADEIWVLDSGSTDATIPLARAAGATVVEVVWKGYAQTKNEGHALTALPYILSLDADEWLSEGLRAEMLAIKHTLNGEAWSMPRRSWYCGRWIRHCGWSPDRKTRLFPRDTRWQGEFVHETVALPAGTSTRPFRHHLMHFTYPDTSSHLQQIERYSTLAAQDLHSRGKRASWMKLLLAPAFKFVQMYVLKAGFLDGWQGWQLCHMSAIGVMAKYAKLRELRDGIK